MLQVLTLTFHFTCPECDEAFPVPGDAAGALIDCTACPWTGLCTYVEVDHA